MQDLLIMRENAQRSGIDEYVRLSENALTERFPTWNTKSRRGKSTPVNVMFLQKQRHFDTQKEGYVWLIERFIGYYPKPFMEVDWETYFVAIGPRTLYFAKSLDKLFDSKAHLAEDKNKFRRLTNGWYAKLVLSEKQKFDLLIKFAAIAELRLRDDWDWEVPLHAHRNVDIDNILPELG